MTYNPESNSDNLAAKLAALIPTDGKHPTAIDALTLIRVSNATPPTPVVYSPKLFVVAQGKKDVIAGRETITCDAFQYLLLTVPLPIQGKITQARADKPFLALNLNLDMVVVTELIQQMTASKGESGSADCAIQANPVDADLLDAFQRLLDTLTDRESARILGNMAVREIYYRLLRRREGQLLRAFVQRDRHSFRIARVLDYIQENLHQSLAIEALAAMASMSPSSFYEHFKTVTDASPQQYIKSLRLDRARRQLVEQGVSVSEVAYQVGYTSASQFSREFKRVFGVSPRDAVAPLGGFSGL